MRSLRSRQVGKGRSGRHRQLFVLVLICIGCGCMVVVQIWKSFTVVQLARQREEDSSPVLSSTASATDHVDPVGAKVEISTGPHVSKIAFKSPTTATRTEEQYARQALAKHSSLRFDWTNLPPMTPLGREIERTQSQCLNATAVKEFGPQEIVQFNLVPSGMGSALHTWMNPLCHAAEHNKLLLTGSKWWLWNDRIQCPGQLEAQAATRSSDWIEATETLGYIPKQSALWCYFGWHESALRCPPGTILWRDRHNRTTTMNKNRRQELTWGDYHCDKYHEEYGRTGVLQAVTEWLFQNVSQLVIQEAERQIRHEAFPLSVSVDGSVPTQQPFNTTTITSTKERSLFSEDSSSQGFQRWSGMPDPDSLITVHIRWGDKSGEMKLVTIEEVINGTLSLLTPEELAGAKTVHIYVATEDPHALKAFRQSAKSFKNWLVHTSGPTNPIQTKRSYTMMSAASKTNGKAGLQSLAALLISMQANRYVLATGSNWSRLMNELRLTVVDSRCRSCTRMIDLRYGQC